MPRSKQEAFQRKKRRGGHVSKNSPFPVPMVTMAEPMPEGAWFYYTGYVEGSSVVVKHSGDIDFLHKMGFFGKGTLSRSEPSFYERKHRVNIRLPKAHVEGKEGLPTHARAIVTSKRNYLAHKRYKALAEGNGTEYNYINHCEEQQKLGLEGLSGGEDEDNKDEEEEEEDEDEEEENEIFSGGAGTRGAGGKRGMVEAFFMLDAKRGSLGAVPGSSSSTLSQRQQLYSEASQEARGAVLALLSEIAAISSEKIATFAQVPHTLAQMEEKYKALYKSELSFFQQRQQQYAKLVQSLAARGGGFGNGEIIDLDDGEDYGGGGGGCDNGSVVVLDSDEEGEDGEGGGGQRKTEDPPKNIASSKSKGWDDYDAEDFEGWGSASNEAKDSGGNRNAESESLSCDKKAKSDGVSSVKNDESESENTPCSKAVESVSADKSGSKTEESNLTERKFVETTKDGKGDGVKAAEGEDGTKAEADLKIKSGENGESCPGAEDAQKVIESERLLKSENGTQSEEKDKKSKSSSDQGGDSSKTLKSDEAVKSNTQSKDDGSKFSPEQSSDDTLLAEKNLPGTPSKVEAVANFSVDVSDETAKTPEDSSDKNNKEAGAEKDNTEKDPDASNDSDDVICIESESATPSKLHNFLSQGRDAPRMLTKSVTFMSNITAQPTFVTAKVGFTSWDSFIHFNYSGDPTHLPTVMAAEHGAASPGKQGQGVAKTQVYERVFPPVSTLLPGPKSPGAVIKQRAKGLPCLRSAYLRQAALSTPKTNAQFQHLASGGNSEGWQMQAQQNKLQSHKPSLKSSQPGVKSTLPVKHAGKKNVALSASSGADLAAFTGPATESAKSDTVATHPSLSLVSKYLKAYGRSSRNSPKKDEEKSFSVGEDSKSGEAKAASTTTVELALSEVSRCCTKLQGLFTSNSLDACSDLPASEETAQLLSKFHSSLSKYLTVAELQGDQESEVLKLLLSDPDSDIISSISEEEFVNTMKSLTSFQRWLMKERQAHVTKTDPSPDEGTSDEETDNKKRKNDELEDTESAESKRPKFSEPAELDQSGLKPSESNTTAVGEVDGTTKNRGGLNSDTPAKNAGEELMDVDSASNKDNTTMNSKDDLDVNEQTTKEDSKPVKESSMSSSSATKEKKPGKAKTDTDSEVMDPSRVDQISIGSSSEDEEDRDSFSSPVLDARSLCRTDDVGGELFVINNTSEEEELEDENEEGEEEEAMKDVHRWRPCIKRDPYPVQERLHLMLEEAFFLSYGLGCLRIMDPESQVLNLTETWCQFQELKEQFVPHYVAYHYFRSKGWVPKSGLKFGCDFILYREGPPFYHGSYSVVVQCVREGSLLPCTRRDGYQLDYRHLSWISLAGLNRITEHVAKELMFCYVIWPKGLSREESLSPKCISKFKVKEVLVSRWVSSQEREAKTEEEMP